MSKSTIRVQNSWAVNPFSPFGSGTGCLPLLSLIVFAAKIAIVAWLTLETSTANTSCSFREELIMTTGSYSTLLAVIFD